MFSKQLQLMLLTILFSATVFSQVTNHSDLDDEFIKSLIESLEKGNILRNELERGHRGDGIHLPLMDQMKSFGIKQVSLAIELTWTNNRLEKARFRFIHYMPRYYEYGVFITDETAIRSIRSSGLEQKAKDEACKIAKGFVNRLSEGRNMTGTIYINLLDDERLPAVADMPELEVITGMPEP